jgi:hypothetical protein
MPFLLALATDIRKFVLRTFLLLFVITLQFVGSTYG